MSDLANANGAAMLAENDALRARIAELERNAERWRECERLAEARGITSHYWSMMFRIDTGTLEGNIDASIASRKERET